MSKSTTFENELLQLIFNNIDIAGIGDTPGLQNSATAGNLYVSLHTADVGEGGTQTTNEANYTSYTRVPVTRSAAGWVISGSTVTPTATIQFPAATGGTNTITHFAIGVTPQPTAGKVLYKGSLSSQIVVTSGVTPQLTTATYVSEA